MARTVMRWSGDGQAAEVEFDAVEIEAPSHGVEITDYPIERGADLTDHVRETPLLLDLTVHVSNSPARLGLTQLDGATQLNEASIQARQPLINTPPSLQLPTSVAGLPLERDVTLRATVRTWDGRLQRVQNVLELLRQSMRQAREWTVATDLMGDFDRMLIKQIDPERTGRSGNGVKIKLRLKQVSYAELVRRDASSFFAAAKKKPKVDTRKKDEGKQDAPEADKQTSSFLYDLWGSLAP